jgi:hypothetical protein
MLIRDMVLNRRGFASFTSFILCFTQYNSCFHATRHSYHAHSMVKSLHSRAFPSLLLIHPSLANNLREFLPCSAAPFDTAPVADSAIDL